MTTAHYQALVREPVLVSGFDENPYQTRQYEGILAVPSHVPKERWTSYCLLELGRRFKHEPAKLILIVRARA